MPQAGLLHTQARAPGCSEECPPPGPPRWAMDRSFLRARAEQPAVRRLRSAAAMAAGAPHVSASEKAPFLLDGQHSPDEAQGRPPERRRPGMTEAEEMSWKRMTRE